MDGWFIIFVRCDLFRVYDAVCCLDLERREVGGEERSWWRGEERRG